MYENTSLIPRDLELHDMNSYLHIGLWSNHSMVLESRTFRDSAHAAKICKPQHWGNMCYVTMIRLGVQPTASTWSHAECCTCPTSQSPCQSAHLLSQRHVCWAQELKRTTHGSFFRREMRGIKFLKIFGHSFQWSIHGIWMCFFDQCSKFAPFWCCRIRDLEIYGTLSTIYCHSNTIYATFEGAFTQGAFQSIGSCC